MPASNANCAASSAATGRVINALAEDPRPHGIVQLAPDVYRLRVGSYRVIYKVLDEDKLVLIGRIARRSGSTYQDLGRLFGIE